MEALDAAGVRVATNPTAAGELMAEVVARAVARSAPMRRRRARVQLAERVDAALDAPGAAVHGLVAERVGEPLDGEARRDRVSVQVQLAVDLDERHRAVVAGEDRERGRAQVLAVAAGARSARRAGSAAGRRGA